MGWPSSHEHDQEKRDEAAFAEHEMAGDLKAILISPVSKQRKSKKAPSNARTPAGKLNYVDRLERKIQEQSALISSLKAELKETKRVLASEKEHVAQLKRRENKNSNLLLERELRRVRSEYEAKIAGLTAKLEANEQELDGLRKFTMQSLFPRNG